MKETLLNIQSLRGIAVLAVVIFHLVGIQRKYSPDYALPEFIQLGAIGVDIFFLISGFLMMTVTRSVMPGTKNAMSFITHRCIRIYPMYWIASAPIFAILLVNSDPILAALYINPEAIRNLPTAPHYLLKSLLLLPQEHLPPLTVSWTLIHEIYFYFIFGVLLLLPAKLRIHALIIWSILTLAFWQYLKPTQTQALRYLLCNPLTLEFTTGCFIAALLQQWQIKKPAPVLLAGIVWAIASWALWISNRGTYEFPIAGDRVTYFLIPCALILAGSVSLERQGHIFYAWLQKTGDASYSLYLTHILFLSAGRKVWQAHGDKTSLVENLLWWPTLLAVTIMGGLLCYQWIEKPLLDFLRSTILRRTIGTQKKSLV